MVRDHNTSGNVDFFGLYSSGFGINDGVMVDGDEVGMTIFSSDGVADCRGSFSGGGGADMKIRTVDGLDR